MLDFTNKNSHKNDFLNTLMEEQEILPQQITDFKVGYHQKFLANWLKKQPSLSLSISQLWEIREQCFRDISTTLLLSSIIMCFRFQH